MENNMKRYLAMAEWHLRNLPAEKRDKIIKDIRYDMELRKLREGLTEDELILKMDSPRKMAARHGGIDAPMPYREIPPRGREATEETVLIKRPRRSTDGRAHIKDRSAYGPITPGKVLEAFFGVMAAALAISLVPVVGAIALAMVVLGLALPILGATGAALAGAAVMMGVLPAAVPLLHIIIFFIGINFMASINKRDRHTGRRMV